MTHFKGRRRLGCVCVCVCVCCDTYHEGCVVTERQQSQSHPVQYVDHPSHSCILAKRHQPHPSVVMDTLIVHQSDPLCVRVCVYVGGGQH